MNVTVRGRTRHYHRLIRRENNAVVLIDQRPPPHEFVMVTTAEFRQTIEQLPI
jgi:hypothetical protein